MRRLTVHDWPGNIRQLQSVLKYAIVQAPGDMLTLDSLPENFRSPAPAGQEPTPDEAPVGAGDSGDNPTAQTEEDDAPGEASLAGLAELTKGLLRAGELDIYRRVCLALDHVVLEAVLRHVQGNQVKASQLLGISRTTLRTTLRAARRERPASSDPDETANPDH